MSDALPLWRSMLFVPAIVEKFIARAAERGADAIILDLEDSVPLAEKQRARDALAAAPMSWCASTGPGAWRCATSRRRSCPACRR
jgi:citrate lyase subunit beta/citryl-CoA lyase